MLKYPKGMKQLIRSEWFWRLIIIVSIGLFLLRYTGIIGYSISDLSRLFTVQTKYKFGCNRTQRYPNPPTFDHALSLLDDLKPNQSDTLSTTSDQPIIPCIIVKYRDLRSEKEAEGYFLTVDREVKENYFPIYVDQRFRADDYITALLLAHPMTHLHQYLVSVSVNQSPSCLDNEVEAFTSQAMFIEALPKEKRQPLIDEFLTEPQYQNMDVFREILSTREGALKTCGQFDPCFFPKILLRILPL